jgi:hypothetical protein
MQSSTLKHCTPSSTTEAAMCHCVAQATAWCQITTVLSSCFPAQMLHRQWKIWIDAWLVCTKVTRLVDEKRDDDVLVEHLTPQTGSRLNLPKQESP